MQTSVREEQPSWPGRGGPRCRDPASQLNSLLKFGFVYMRRRPALAFLARSRYSIPEISLEIFHINALKRRAG